MSDTHAHAADHHDDHDHVVPLWLLAGVFAALLVLTVITVAVSELQLGDVALLVAMVVAVVKASLVGLFFMHLFWDSKFNTVAIIAAFIFLGLFISLAILDSAEYQPDQTTWNYTNPAIKPVAAPEGALHAPAHGEPGHNHDTDHAPAKPDSDDAHPDSSAPAPAPAPAKPEAEPAHGS